MRLDRLEAIDLSDWVELAKAQTNRGQVINRIPRLAAADPGWFAIH
jgi:glutaminase